jgi:hypothetical protein
MRAQDEAKSIVTKDGDILEPWHIIVICILFVVGITVFTTCFFIVRRLHELHTQHNKVDGELFISDSGEMYSEFVVPVDELISKNYILMKVNHVAIKGGEKK